MARKPLMWAIGLGVLMAATVAWAGSSGNAPGAAEGGGSGAEPGMLALMLASVAPAIWFTRRAVLSRRNRG